MDKPVTHDPADILKLPDGTCPTPNRLFLVVPPFNRGGDEWQTVVAARNEKEACALADAYTGQSTEELGDLEQIADDPGLTGNDRWAVWEFPDLAQYLRALAAPRAIAWDAFTRTQWKEVE